MDDMRRRTLRLLGISVVTIASPKLSSALAFKTAMGPVSAPMKPGGPAAGAATMGTPSESAHRKLRKGPKHRHLR